MKIAVLILLSFMCTGIYAQDKIEAERPSESLSPKILTKNIFQLETGLRKTKQEEDEVWRTPNALFRFGLLKKLELRLETSVENQKLVSENSSKEGLMPVELGIKANIFETKNEAFSSSIVGQIGIPKLASKDHQASNAYHRVRLLFENKLTDKISLNYNIGSDWDSENQEQNWVYTFTPQFELGEKWDAFVEVYGFIKKDELPENVFDAGVAYFVGKNFKLDLSTGRGLNHQSPDYFVAVGFSFRLGQKK